MSWCAPQLNFNTMKNFILAVLMLTLTSCGVQWHLSTTNHDPIYGPTLVVADDVKVDTLNYTQFKRKLRTDFSFRWDYANYMATQPLSFYWRNWNVGPRYLGNVHDFWWNSHQYWTDWAFNYPFNSYYSDRWWRPNRWNWGYGGGWYSNTWNNHWYQYGYSGWYGHDSMLWGSQWRRNNVGVAYINGRRGSNNVIVGGRTNVIKDRVIVNKNKPRRNFVIEEDGVRWYSGSENDNVDKEVIKPRVYTNPNNVINNNNIRVRPNNNSNNNIRVNPNNNSRSINNNVRGSWRPNNNSNNNIRSSSPPVINRGSSNISRGSSSSSSSRGGRGKN